ncbi:hypothetical protein [Saccharicrinis sp. GN24d3]|uniref:hypothetical protein n=1 Tax=Saccharicrinis sp. GN24d3 TaxID=3458416 RepID=UPI00403668C7
MEKLLIFIKHRLNFVWGIIEKINTAFFTFLYSNKLNGILLGIFKEYGFGKYTYKRLVPNDAKALEFLVNKQIVSDLKYFKPHGFDLISIEKQFGKKSFLMMGTFDGERLIGYFFLRFFANKKCFVGRLIDADYRGKGIGLVMNKIMYNISWKMGFRCLSTISKNNKAVIGAHKKNAAMVVLKELQNDYLLVEFISEQKDN